MEQLDTRLLLTLCYSAQFRYPLTASEWRLRLLQTTSPTSAATSALTALAYSPQALAAAIKQLVDQGLVTTFAGYFYLPSQPDAVSTRLRREHATQAKEVELRPLLRFLAWLPGVAGVAITGSAAVNNAEPDDDVDLLIVTENQRLWLVRPVVVFFAFLYGKRRTWQREEKNSWCFNLWLERSSLSQPLPTRSLYVAYEVCQAKWLIDKSGCARSFWQQNVWVASYLPAFYSWRQQQPIPYQVYETRLRLADWPVLAEVAQWVNELAYLLQRWYMKRHMTRERVERQFAFFHPRDTGQIVSDQYRAIVSELSRTA